MTYNHEETKVRDPSAAREVERLREVLAEALSTIEAQCDDISHMQALIDSLYDDLQYCDAP